VALNFIKEAESEEVQEDANNSSLALYQVVSLSDSC